MGRLNRNGMVVRRAAILAATLILAMNATRAHAVDAWIQPTPEELSMTSLPGHPNVPAVILFHEQITRDDMHSVMEYQRIKILTEKGKDRANVELRFASFAGDDFEMGEDKEITDIAGRTIHPDGTIIPFTGKPYLKMIEKGKNVKYQARVFTLPDVEVGSIIEYRYAVRIGDYVFEAPDWYIQDDNLFTKSVHFAWYPTTHQLTSKDDGMISAITWFPILPAGVEIVHHTLPPSGMADNPPQTYELTAHDIAPQPDEDFMPPIRSFTYRVLFAYSGYRSAEDFWKAKGKQWVKREDSFIGPNGDLKAATQKAIAGAQTSDEKLRKIYAAVMALENTNFTRDHNTAENKAEGAKISNAGDVFKAGRGDSDQLTAVFIGMARAAGMKAYPMLVPDRSKRIFTQGWMSFGQFDDTIAIVNVDGKELFFDPGQRYCQYGQLAWKDTFAEGLRQTDGGTNFVPTPSENYTETKTVRIADLSMNAHGEITGSINMSYLGATALEWRQRGLRGDDESLKTGLRTDLEGMLPKTLEVKVTSIENLTDYEKPLIVKFDVTGGLGTATGKRMILPADVFLTANSATFPYETREQPVYFNYPQTVQDAMRIKFPSTMAVEAVPAGVKVMFQDEAQYSLNATSASNSVTVQRNLISNSLIVPVKNYGDLRTFYSQLETKDQDSIVLKVADNAASAGN